MEAERLVTATVLYEILYLINPENIVIFLRNVVDIHIRITY
jgi:hypothetical protein